MKQQMIELDLKLKVSTKLIRKIKAYAVLVDQKPAEFVEYFTSEILAAKLDSMIEALIRGELDGEDVRFTTPNKAKQPAEAKTNWQSKVETDLSDQGAELVDDDELLEQALKDEEEIDSMHSIPGGVTDEDIEQDMSVEDPDHEAAGSAEDIEDSRAGVDLFTIKDPEKRRAVKQHKEETDLQSFAEAMGIDLSNVDEHVVGARKLNPDLGKGRVSAFGATETERSSF